MRWTRVPEQYGEVDARAYLLQRYDVDRTPARPRRSRSSPRDDLERLLGSISLLRLAWEHARAEVGYWLAPEARGQGHATRALRLISALGFRQLGLERIDLFAATGNPASQRVAERGGFTREAVLARTCAARTASSTWSRSACSRATDAPRASLYRMDLEPLRDGHGRLIGDLRVSVTDRCNFRCQYCMPAEGLPWLERSEILTFEEITRLVSLLGAMGVHDVRLTGGEPLVRRNFPHLAADARRARGCRTTCR